MIAAGFMLPKSAGAQNLTGTACQDLNPDRMS
jgi:hypothetical protein